MWGRKRGKGEEGSGVQGDKGGEGGAAREAGGEQSKGGKEGAAMEGGAAKSTLIHLQRPAEDLRSGSAQHPTGG